MMGGHVPRHDDDGQILSLMVEGCRFFTTEAQGSVLAKAPLYGGAQLEATLTLPPSGSPLGISPKRTPMGTGAVRLPKAALGDWQISGETPLLDCSEGGGAGTNDIDPSVDSTSGHCGRPTPARIGIVICTLGCIIRRDGYCPCVLRKSGFRSCYPDQR